MFPLLFGFSHSAVSGGVMVIPDDFLLPEDDEGEIVPILLWFIGDE